MTQTFIKDPSDIIDYQISWSSWLNGDTIATSEWTLPGGLTESDSSNTTTTATITLAGGTSGRDYKVYNTITTAGGRTNRDFIVIRVRASNTIVTLEEAKLHLRVTGTDEDTLLLLYIRAAKDYIERFLNTPIPGTADSPYEEPPEAIKAAALLIIGGMYENREDVIAGTVQENRAVMNLLYPFRTQIGI